MLLSDVPRNQDDLINTAKYAFTNIRLINLIVETEGLGVYLKFPFFISSLNF